MEPFGILRARLAPFPATQVDTDQILPARFLHRPRATDHADFLFADLRKAPDFFLNDRRWANARILVAGSGFGTGSSREAAVYALWDWGIRCVIAPDFGDIFHGNCLKNGLLPVRLSVDIVARMQAALAKAELAPEGEVDLPAQVVRVPGLPDTPFAIDPLPKRCLLEGLDEISLTRGYAGLIDRFETARLTAEPWVNPPGGRVG